MPLLPMLPKIASTVKPDPFGTAELPNYGPAMASQMAQLLAGGPRMQQGQIAQQPAAPMQNPMPNPNVMQGVNQLFDKDLLHGGGRSVKTNMDGSLRDPNAPTGLDWLEANGPGRQSVTDRFNRMGNETSARAAAAGQAVAMRKAQQAQNPVLDPIAARFPVDAVGNKLALDAQGQPVGFSGTPPGTQDFGPGGATSQDLQANIANAARQFQFPEFAQAPQGPPQSAAGQTPVHPLFAQGGSNAQTNESQPMPQASAPQQSPTKPSKMTMPLIAAKPLSRQQSQPQVIQAPAQPSQSPFMKDLGWLMDLLGMNDPRTEAFRKSGNF